MAMKTPGVYIVEKNAFPNSVVEVATAVPAFIGYTAKADNKGKSLANKPQKITSMAEYRNFFGGPPEPKFSITEPGPNEEADFSLSDGQSFVLKKASGKYLLYYSMMLFFQNGGGPCYIVSVGQYGAANADEKAPVKKDGKADDKAVPPAANGVEASKLQAGIKLLIKEQEPTMVVIPEAVLLEPGECISTQQAMVNHCGIEMKSRIAILDVWGGDKDENTNNCISKFRNSLAIDTPDFASAYYPWLNTTIIEDSDLSFDNFADKTKLRGLLEADIKSRKAQDERSKAIQEQQLAQIGEIAKTWDTKIDPDDAKAIADKDQKAKSLVTMSPLYVNLLAAVKKKINILPPAAAMAGVYTRVDNLRGVWKAPANVSLNAVVSPTVEISHYDQEDLNVHVKGKSINAIRSFIGEGTLVWGARTLDGNSLDWRYVNVRRTMIMLEESIRLAAKAYVFEPNVANTWVTVKSMIRNFLTGIWKRGGLAGAVPNDAFNVYVGLGETMTSEDILEGILRVTVLVAISRPAEFIEITFQQKMQES